MHSSTGPASNVNSSSTSAPRSGPTSSSAPLSTSQSTNVVRPVVKGSSTTTTTTANRPNSNSQSGPQQQQQRGNNNYYQQNNRGNYWNDNNHQDHSPARRSGTNVLTAPNEQQVFVGSLPLEFTKDTLIEFFSQFGNVLDAKIHVPAHENNNKKVCFLVYFLTKKKNYFEFTIEFWLCCF